MMEPDLFKLISITDHLSLELTGGGTRESVHTSTPTASAPIVGWRRSSTRVPYGGLIVYRVVRSVSQNPFTIIIPPEQLPITAFAPGVPKSPIKAWPEPMTLVMRQSLIQRPNRAERSLAKVEIAALASG